jgi:hypothetical protein
LEVGASSWVFGKIVDGFALVDLALLQSVSYIAGALGVCVAAFYYVLNLNEVRLNRRLTFTTNFILPITSKDGMQNFAKFIAMRWSDFDDFKKKYDHTVDPENFVARQTYWQTCEALGYQLKRGLIDIETVYEMAGEHIIDTWLMFKPLIEEYKRFGQYGKDSYANFEYLVDRLMKIKLERDPTYSPFNRSTAPQTGKV